MGHTTLKIVSVILLAIKDLIQIIPNTKLILVKTGNLASTFDENIKFFSFYYQ